MTQILTLKVSLGNGILHLISIELVKAVSLHNLCDETFAHEDMLDCRFYRTGASTRRAGYCNNGVPLGHDSNKFL